MDSPDLMKKARSELLSKGCSEQQGRFACDGYIVIVSDGSRGLLLEGGVGRKPGSAAVVSRTRMTITESLLVKMGLIEGPLSL